eukprot:3005999-Alexandrium_andersonii.AAC.1
MLLIPTAKREHRPTCARKAGCVALHGIRSVPTNHVPHQIHHAQAPPRLTVSDARRGMHVPQQSPLRHRREHLTCASARRNSSRGLPRPQCKLNIRGLPHPERPMCRTHTALSLSCARRPWSGAAQLTLTHAAEGPASLTATACPSLAVASDAHIAGAELELLIGHAVHLPSGNASNPEAGEASTKAARAAGPELELITGPSVCAPSRTASKSGASAAGAEAANTGRRQRVSETHHQASNHIAPQCQSHS